MTRRRVLFGTGALVATGTIGGIAVTTNNASATVSGEFAIPNGEATLAGEQLEDVRLSVDANYQYSANAKIHGVELELHVGASPATLDMIARYTRDDLGTDELTGTQTLVGSLINASDFDLEDFQPTTGELRRTVVAELRFYALRNGEVVAKATQSDTFEVSVTKEALQVDVSLAGTGDVTFKTSPS